MLVKNILNLQAHLLLLCFVVIFLVGCSDAGKNASEEEENVTINASDTIDLVKVVVGQTVEMTSGDVSAFTISGANNLLVIEIQWTIVSKPTNSKATIENPDSTMPVFTPDIVGDYVLQVVISQGGEVLATKEIKIVVGVNDLFPVKPANHIPTTDLCADCHVVGEWVISGVDHTQVLGTCVACHDGIIASGKSLNHIASDDVCEACHSVPPSTWIDTISDLPPDHTGFVGNCITCHDGVVASGKGINHVLTTEECDICHITQAWLPVIATGI